MKWIYLKMGKNIRKSVKFKRLLWLHCKSDADNIQINSYLILLPFSLLINSRSLISNDHGTQQLSRTVEKTHWGSENARNIVREMFYFPLVWMCQGFKGSTGSVPVQLILFIGWPLVDAWNITLFIQWTLIQNSSQVMNTVGGNNGVQ